MLRSSVGIEANRRYQRATDTIDQVACELLGINRTDARCLDVLDQRGRLSAGELAVEAGLSPGAVTAMLDRLERAGYVRRVRDVDDRRRVFVEATELARRLAWEIYGPMGEMGAPVIARFSDDELRAIKEFLEDGADVQLRRAAQLREQLERDGPLRPAVDREAG